jgi:hypothetical protein
MSHLLLYVVGYKICHTKILVNGKSNEAAINAQRYIEFWSASLVVRLNLLDKIEAINPFPFCPKISLNLDLILSEFKKWTILLLPFVRYLRVCFCYFHLLLLLVLLFQLRLVLSTTIL